MTPLVAQMVKHLPAVPKTQVQSLDCEDLLEKEMAMHTSILAWKIPWMEEPGGLKSMGSEEGMATYSSIIAWRIPWKKSLASFSIQGCKSLTCLTQLNMHNTSYNNIHNISLYTLIYNFK